MIYQRTDANMTSSWTTICLFNVENKLDFMLPWVCTLIHVDYITLKNAIRTSVTLSCALCTTFNWRAQSKNDPLIFRPFLKVFRSSWQLLLKTFKNGRKIKGSFLLWAFQLWSITEQQGPVVQRPIRANPGLNFNPSFFISSIKSLLGKNFHY